MKTFVTVSLLALLFATTPFALATDQAEAEAIYAQWLQFLADRNPDAAIEMTSPDFIMVNHETAMDRAAALSFQQGLAQFILSRDCTNSVVAYKELPLKSSLLLSRLDCVFHTVQGDLPAHVLETMIVDKRGVITYDAFSDAPQSLP